MKMSIFQEIALFMTVLVIIAWVATLYRKSTEAKPKDEQTPEVTATEGYTFEDLLDTLRFIESTDGLRIYGNNGEIGDYQLKKIYVDDVNRIQRLLGYNGEKPYMAYVDRFNEKKSRRATSIVVSHYANATWKDKPHTPLQWLETAARAHHRPADRNNSKTDAYWEKVKARMERK